MSHPVFRHACRHRAVRAVAFNSADAGNWRTSTAGDSSLDEVIVVANPRTGTAVQGRQLGHRPDRCGHPSQSVADGLGPAGTDPWTDGCARRRNRPADFGVHSRSGERPDRRRDRRRCSLGQSVVGNTGGFDFENLLTGDVTRIEILRVAQSTLYGSQAMGGVINITTADPMAPPGER